MCVPHSTPTSSRGNTGSRGSSALPKPHEEDPSLRNLKNNRNPTGSYKQTRLYKRGQRSDYITVSCRTAICSIILRIITGWKKKPGSPTCCSTEMMFCSRFLNSSTSPLILENLFTEELLKNAELHVLYICSMVTSGTPFCSVLYQEWNIFQRPRTLLSKEPSKKQFFFGEWTTSKQLMVFGGPSE